MLEIPTKLENYIGGKWTPTLSNEFLPVHNPATGEILCHTPNSTPREVELAAQAASQAFPAWRSLPAPDRIQYLFELKNLLEFHFNDLAETIVMENGKTLKEAQGELRRAIENVEVACGIPTMMQGHLLEDIARGIDEFMIRQPLGVVAIISPFNFPGMIPFWFLPYALACGNTVVVKPSERTPITMYKVFQLLDSLDLPPGVVNLVNGSVQTVDAILDHPQIKAVSFVGSTVVARKIYSRAAANGKRVQAQGGAKNPLVILPDADLELTAQIVTDSVFGNAGQRCLAASLVVTVGKEAAHAFPQALAQAAQERVVGYGLDPKTQMGPVISQQSKQRIQTLIQNGIYEGASLLVDGREAKITGYENGYFMRPSILENVPVDGEIFRTEIFGPVMGLMHVDTLDEAIQLVNMGTYGNMACLFTQDGAAARRFRNEAQAGNIGINIGVAAPMAFFPFSGWKDSFFGTLHGQSHHAVEFYTQTKIVIERWPKHWSRQF
ncbi:MAG TPA: CoA-acylating methylmalonate-semialdehyde dehydrogenase [Anaerolineales bacterium]|nr:CoA-acylating methylmalonate-semialdehyde dehydrogenase [Anaerolineales bacterium]